MLEHMHFKQFTKFCYQSKIIPTLATIDDINSNFKIIVSAYRAPGQRGEEGKFSPYIDEDMFKRALVRIALTGKGSEEHLKDEELTAEIQKQMRDEFYKETADKPGQDFDHWMQQQDDKGAGLRHRLTQK